MRGRQALLALVGLHRIGGFDVTLRVVGLGQYGADPCIFLGRCDGSVAGSGARVEVGQEVLPLVLAKDYAETLGAGTRLDARSLARSLATRDGGLWDALPFEDWSSGAYSLPKRYAYDTITTERQEPNAWKTLQRVFREVTSGAGFLTCALEDDYRGAEEGRVSLGGAVVVARDTRFRDGAAGAAGTLLLECRPDEAVALSSGLDLPLQIDAALFDAAAVEVMELKFTGDRISIATRPPPPGSEVEAEAPAANAPEAWEIASAEVFLDLSPEGKRRVGAASGLTLPRRGRGEEVLDGMLLQLLDEDVRRDVLLMRALKSGDMEEAGRLAQGRSRRGELKVALRAAVAAEDYDRAAVLRRELDVEDARRADTAQDEGSYDRYLDADAWYLEDLEK